MTMTQVPTGRNNGIAFVGEAPGRFEVLRGKPFVGRSGNLLKQLCNNAGIDLSESFITNIVDTMPPAGQFNFFPKDVIAEGKKKALERLNRWKPNLVVTLGKNPSAFLLKKQKISTFRGSVQLSPVIPGQKVLPTYHPAFLLPEREDSHYAPIVQLDFHKAKRESSFSEIRWPERNISIIKNPHVAVDFLHNLPLKPVTCDIETCGSILTAFGIATGPKDCYSITHDCCKQPDVIRAIGRFCQSGIPKIFHNVCYDVLWLALHMGIRTENIYFDTMLAQHVCYSIYLKSLAFCASIYTDEPYWKGRDDYLPSNDLYTYNARDCGVTFEVYEHLLDEIKEAHLEGSFQRAMRLIKPVLVASYLGVRTNPDAVESIKKQVEERIAKLNRIADKVIPGVNVNSSKQLAQLFYGDWGFKPKKNKGRITTDAKACSKMEKMPTPYQPIFGLIRNLKKNLKSKTFYNFTADPDGRVRTAYKIHGTKTFRLSSSTGITGSGQNLQNQPKIMRQIYIPDEGEIFIQWDLSQAEARVVAALCKDKKWLREFEEDDIHWRVAEWIFQKPRKDLIKKVHRQAAKKVAHATHYLQGWMLLSEQISCTAAEAKKFISDYYRLRSGLEDWHAEVEMNVRDKRELRTPYGDRMIFPGDISGDALPLPQAVAFIPQSTSVQYANTAWLAQYEQIPYAKQLLQVHDSLNSSVPDNLDTIYETMKKMKELTEVPLLIGNIELIIPVDFEIGYDWYHMKEVTFDSLEETYQNLRGRDVKC